MPSPRTLRRASALAPLLGLLLVVPPAPADATTTTVSVQDFSFLPGTVSVGLGQSVTWVFHAMHTTTSNQRFWNSGARDTGSYVATFADAGTFGYHCTMHPFMTGKVRVPLGVRPTAAGGVAVRWSVRTSTPANRRFDVQFRRAGATTWSWFRRATAARAGSFRPARAGRYVLRSRTRNVGVGSSGWSPAATVSIS